MQEARIESDEPHSEDVEASAVRPHGVLGDAAPDADPDHELGAADLRAESKPERAPARIAATPRAGIGRLAATVDRLDGKLREAESTADARALVDLAKGILIERQRCGPAQAARQLNELAERSGLPLLELAADLVNEVANDPLSRSLRGLPRGTGSGPSGATAREPGASSSMRAAEAGVLAAADVQSAARSLKTQALDPLGAVAVAVWALTSDGSLVLAGHSGFHPVEASRWHHIPPGVATLAREALTRRSPTWTADVAGDPIPSIGLRNCRQGAGRVAIPAELAGRVLGVLEICWPGPVEDFPPQVHRQLEALAELCAHTLDVDPALAEADGHTPIELIRDTPLTDLVDGLLDSAMVLQPLRDPDGRLADFVVVHANEHFSDPSGRPRAMIVGMPLLRAYPMAAAESGLYETVEHVYATGEPFHTERMVLNGLIGQVPVSTVAAVGVSRFGAAVVLTWRLEDEATRLAALLHHAQRLGQIGGFEENLVTGASVWNAQLYSLFGLPATAQPVPLRKLDTHAHPDDADTLSRFLRAILHHHTSASTAFRLRRGDGVLRYIRIVAEPVIDETGLLTGVRGACQDISSQHWTEIALAATRDRLEHSEREAAERNSLTLRLQRAIMPSAPEQIDAWGLKIAVRYRPAEKDHLVGGDWYDAVVLPGKQVLLAVGDVAGHGIEAATDMVALRNALRGLAATGAGPAKLLSWLNTVAHHMTGKIVTATAVCALYDPEERTLRWAVAGHLPPILVRDGTAITLPMPRGILLGATDEAGYDEETITLEQDDVLLMYTDGLVERRDTSLDKSLEQLLTAVRKPLPDLGERLDHLLIHSNADTDDDTCLIGIQLR